jgi:hypothetical protein
MLCEKLIPESAIACRDPNGPFGWREGNVVYDVHDGVQELNRG